MVKKVLLTSIVLLIAIPVFSFEHIRCYTDNYISNKMEQNPDFEKAFHQTYDYIYNMARHNRDMNDSVIFRIPVVVHVVYNTPQQNVHDSLIFNQIEVLNQDFRRQNPDTSLTREIFLPYAGDAGIEFFLAEEDPDGNPTNGITRTETSEVTFMDFADLDKVKSSATGGVDAWPTDVYLNIWVCNLNFVFGGTEFPGVLGFAYPPVGAPNWPQDMLPNNPDVEGVVVHYQAFGRNNPEAVGPLEVVSRGRTTTHEVGHYLGLRHIWGDAGFGQNGCDVDDGIDDTPNQADASQQTCNYNQNSCVISPVNYPDMLENYMDYSDERCMNMFTHGQIAVMRMVLRELRPDLAIQEHPPVTSVNENLAFNQKHVIYPNPVADKLYVSMNEAMPIGLVEIYDMKGRQLKAKNFNHLNYQKLMLETNQLATGNYILKIHSGKTVIVDRFNVAGN